MAAQQIQQGIIICVQLVELLLKQPNIGKDFFFSVFHMLLQGLGLGHRYVVLQFT